MNNCITKRPATNISLFCEKFKNKMWKRKIYDPTRRVQKYAVVKSEVVSSEMLTKKTITAGINNNDGVSFILLCSENFIIYKNLVPLFKRLLNI